MCISTNELLESKTTDHGKNPRMVEKNTEGGMRYAVEFDYLGRVYRTNWTSFRDEACSWGKSVQAYGWCVSGRPGPTT